MFAFFTETAATGASAMSTILMFVVIIAVFYFFMIRPENKRKKEADAMRNALKVGDNITTIGGVIGDIVAIKDNSIVVETSSDRVRIEFDSAYETAMLMRGGDNVRSAPRGNLLTQCGWCRGAFDVTVIVCNGVAEFQLPGDHVLLTGCTLRPPYAIDAYARGDMDIEPK